LCAGCHRYYTDWPREFSHFITEKIGSEKYEELKRLAEEPTKVNWEDKYKQLKEESDVK
jgi:ribosomal protein L24E